MKSVEGVSSIDAQSLIFCSSGKKNRQYDKSAFKEKIYFRKEFTIELRDNFILDGVIRNLIQTAVIEEVFQHKMAKI